MKTNPSSPPSHWPQPSRSRPQTPAKPATTPVHRTATATVAPCAKVPELSPKIPALPAGTPCAKPLFRFTTSRPSSSTTSHRSSPPRPARASASPPPPSSSPTPRSRSATGNLAEPKMYYTLQYTGYLVGRHQVRLLPSTAPSLFTFPVGAHKVHPRLGPSASRA